MKTVVKNIHFLVKIQTKKSDRDIDSTITKQ